MANNRIAGGRGSTTSAAYFPAQLVTPPYPVGLPPHYGIYSPGVAGVGEAPATDATHRILDASTATLPTGWSEARASSATYYNSSGVVSTATSNTLRNDYTSGAVLRGYLLEGASTNLAKWSGGINTANSPWTADPSQSITSTTVADPAGGTSASTISISGSVGGAIYQLQQPITLGAIYTVSAWVKQSASGASTHVRLTTNTAAAFNSGISGKFALTSTWTRVSITGVIGSVNTGLGSVCNFGFDNRDQTGTRDSNVSGNIDVWGMQLELGSDLTSYIATTTASVARAADVASFTLDAAATDLTLTYDDGSVTIYTGVPPGSTFNVPTSSSLDLLYVDDNVAAAGSVGAASGAGTATAEGASTDASQGASSGSATVTAGGASTAASVGSSTGTGAATAVGASTAASVGNATGSGVATAIGASTARSIGAAAGSGAATAVGASTAASVGSAAGSGPATAVGASTAASVGSSSGSGTAIAKSISSAVGSAAGTGSATAVGISTAASVGSAAGTETVTAVGAGTDASVGSSAGSSTASAVGASTASAVGASAGSGAAPAAGAAAAAGVGSSAGHATATAFTGIVAQAAGSGTATGTGASTAAAVGSAAGSATVAAVSSSASAGSAAGAATVSGVGQATFQAVGSATGIGSASGTSSGATISAVGSSAGAGSASATSPAAVTTVVSATGIAVGSSTSIGYAPSIDFSDDFGDDFATLLITLPEQNDFGPDFNFDFAVLHEASFNDDFNDDFAVRHITQDFNEDFSNDFAVHHVAQTIVSGVGVSAGASIVAGRITTDVETPPVYPLPPPPVPLVWHPAHEYRRVQPPRAIRIHRHGTELRRSTPRSMKRRYG